MRSVARLGMIARWQPVHQGNAAVLRGVCGFSEQALIGIGSSNRSDLRKPFPAAVRARDSGTRDAGAGGGGSMCSWGCAALSITRR